MFDNLPLNFAELRAVNITRCESCFHALDSWSVSDWTTAMAGECGEVCNCVKKRAIFESTQNN